MQAGDPAALARAICDRHTGVGADGWIADRTARVTMTPAAIELWNSDGSRSEISGNGTRCAAALLVEAGTRRGRGPHRHRRGRQDISAARSPRASLSLSK